jgi:hypothetical protein
LIKDEDLRATAGLENKKLTKKNFNWSELSKQTLAVYSPLEKIKAARFKIAHV